MIVYLLLRFGDSHCILELNTTFVLKVLHLLGPKTEADLEKKAKVTHIRTF